MYIDFYMTTGAHALYIRLLPILVVLKASKWVRL